MEEIKKKVKILGLTDNVMFLGQKDNVNEYYNAMDLFLFPSLYEGLGMVVVEAQANDLPCVVSSEVPRIAKISNNIEFVSLNENELKWSAVIAKSKNIGRKNSVNNKLSEFDIKFENKKLSDFYLSLLNTREHVK